MHRDTGTGWPELPKPGEPEPAQHAEGPGEDAVERPDVGGEPGGEAAGGEPGGGELGGEAAGGELGDEPGDEPDGASAGGSGHAGPARRRRMSAAGAVIWLLLGLLGFALVVQVQSNTTDPLTAARPEDLGRIWSDLQAREDRLRQEIAKLEESQRQLALGAEGRQAAEEEARRRADELGILAGTLPAEGNGLVVRFAPGADKPIRASAILDAVQELRGAGAEAMQISGAGGEAVRIIVSTAFVDGEGKLVVGGVRLVAPYTITVIGEPETMRTALSIPGGVVESVANDGGTVTVQEPGRVRVTALHRQGELRFAQPAS